MVRMQSRAAHMGLTSEAPRFDFSENIYGPVSPLADGSGTACHDLLSPDTHANGLFQGEGVWVGP